MSYSNKEFKNILKELRLERGLSRKGLAELASISFKSIEKYEQGIRLPEIDTIIKLAEALDVKVEILLEPIERYHRLYSLLKRLA